MCKNHLEEKVGDIKWKIQYHKRKLEQYEAFLTVLENAIELQDDIDANR